jgi:hypothetical protein
VLRLPSRPGVVLGLQAADVNRPSHIVAWALGSLLAGLLIAAPRATADIGLMRVSPKVVTPGERVDLEVGCGWCRRADTSFPISLVPLAKAPQLHPCRLKLKGGTENALCSPTAPRPPREHPFVFLGKTSDGRRALPRGSWPAGSKSHLRFAIPEIEPGRYAFVIFSAWRGRAPGGGLVIDTQPGKLLRVLPSEVPAHPAGGGVEATSWIVAGAGTIALLLAAALQFRRRRAV